MAIISPEPDITEAVELPVGVPIEATFQAAEAREGTSARGKWNAVRFAYQLKDDQYPETLGEFVSAFTFMRRPAREYSAHCAAIGIANPLEDWDDAQYKGAPVVLTLTAREIKDENLGTSRIVFDISQVVARG